MFNRLKEIIKQVKNINHNIDEYRKDTIIQSLPTLTYVNRAKKLIEQNKLEEAENILKQALSLPQEDALVYKYLGLLYEKTAQFERSVENYQKSADLNPNDKSIWQRLGFALLSVKEYSKAENSFENANKIQSGNSDTYTGWGMTQMKLNKYGEAREKFLTAFKINKYNFSAMFLCSIMEIKLKMYDMAEDKLKFLINVCPNESNTFEYARLRALRNNIDDGIFYAEKSLQYNPKMLPAYILLGQLYAQNNDEINSGKYFEEAEKQKLFGSNLFLEWGKALEKFGKYDDAKSKLLKACELEPENTDSLAHLGLCCVTRKEFDEAKPILEKVISKDPENSTVRQALGIISYENGEIEKAIQIFRENDEDAVNCFYLAKCYENQGNDVKTRDYYEAALTKNDKYLNAYKDYINFLIINKDYKNAQLKLRKALKISENDIDLLNSMFYTSYILVKENVSEYNVKEALLVAQKIENINPDLFKYPGQKQELISLLPERD